MMDYLRLKITAKDRVGMVLDILKRLYKNDISIHSLEVFPGKVYIKVESLKREKRLRLMEDITSLGEVFKAESVELLPYERNERRLLAMIDAVQDGIMAINHNEEIEIFNRYCENIFQVNKENVLGRNVGDFLGFEAPMIKLLKTGENYDNVEVHIKNRNNNIHYITTGRPIKDDKGKTIGAVASLKDIDEAIELSNVITAKEEIAFKDIIGNSSSILKVKRICSAVARSNSTILLRGESGTGKELFAKAIHNLSSRIDKNFVAINCAALPDNLIESELFGYTKGSFTGAKEDGKDGLFKIADKGTIFLDEIGELSLSLQAKLLRVLQEGTIRKIGSALEEKVNVRVIAATNRNLESMIKDGTFREDLYYRLNVIPIYIPPLRDRIEDIPMLVTFFINKLNKQLDKNIKGAETEFIENLVKYKWPGNVRELRNVVERAMNLCYSSLLNEDNLILDFVRDIEYIREERKNDFSLTLKEVVEAAEKKALLTAIEKSSSFRKAAKALGISHTTIMNKIKKYNIECKE
ncbi:sigma 54-interacting transcriptional regulator [Clostridium sp. CX1]|uniref:sigma 54-interacting transcriptional regulator n=1 Tax=Clostridium sp. CX1 TaxID=2978346 RepID=UPI0021C188E7|nr:sigma 54-interacting transcriptional regulator [Clostridium sp. CX1]MCT8977649.1 sigma 54-interacting transcriptional regulator [Clostridium sp. CX1]